jgi:DNA-directed RNA polymerase specialized sigma24 family protein
MALAHAIAEHLPYLRRYARALAGTQQSGDAYVRACLEAIVADTLVLGTDASPRVALYRLFHRLWDTTYLDSRQAAGADPAAVNNVEKRLELLYPGKHELRINDEGDFFAVSLMVKLSGSISTYKIPHLTAVTAQTITV